MAVTLGLGALVLAVHAALVVDGWRAWSPEATKENTPTPDTATLAGKTAVASTPVGMTSEPSPPTVRVTQVRWVAADTLTSAPLRPEPSASPAPRAKAPPPLPPPRARAEPAPTPLATAPEAPTPDAPAAEIEAPVEVAEAAEAAAPAPDLEIASAARPAQPAPERPTAAPLPKASPPPSAHLIYDVQGTAKGIRYQATGDLNWTAQGGRYDARMEVKLFLLGSRVQTSTGTLGPEGLRPERFADIRRGERATHFERDAGRIRFSSNAPTADLQPGAQDRLSLFLQIAGLLQATPRREGDVMSFQVAGTGGAETWHFEVGAEETLALPAGQTVARRVVRRPREAYDTTVEMWFAPALQHLPVRLRLTQSNGDVVDQLLRARP